MAALKEKLSAIPESFGTDLSMVINLARQAAEKDRLEYVDLPHLIYGLSGVSDCIAANSLRMLDADISLIADQIRKVASEFAQQSKDDPYYSIDAYGAFRKAFMETEKAGREEPDSGDLLLGILSVSVVVRSIFKEYDVTLSQTRKALQEFRAEATGEEVSEDRQLLEFSTAAYRALGIAARYAEEAFGPGSNLGSVFILAGLLAVGRKRGERYRDTATWLWRYISTSLESKDSSLDEVSLLNFEKRYKIAKLVSRPIEYHSDKLSDEGQALISLASQYAQETTGSLRIRMRHLLGAMFVGTFEGRPFDALSMLSEIHRDLAGLRRSFLEHLEGLTQIKGQYRLDDDMEAWQSLINQDIEVESSPMHSDEPAQIDLLNREHVAAALGARLRSIREGDVKEKKPYKKGDKGKERSDPFLMHLHGPWGSGKSTLLNLLEISLRQPLYRWDSRWVVVKFNAWEHQDADPPWWPLMNVVYTEAHKQIIEIERTRLKEEKNNNWFARFWYHLNFFRHPAAKLRLFETRWRIRTAWVPTILVAFGVVCILAFVLLVSLKSSSDELNLSVKLIAAILGLPSLVVGALMTIWHNFFPNAASSAKLFMKLRNNPTRILSKHFRDLVDRIGEPIAVFIDDLDRCKEHFVVKLLEQIQTLFRDAPIVYVVASDRDWIRTSFDVVYEKFKEAIKKPGRPMGYLFLEKIFQLSVAVPPMYSESRKAFWQGLIGVKQAEVDVRQEDKTISPEKLREIRKAREEEFSGVRTDEESDMKLKQYAGDDVEDMEGRRAAALNMVDPAMMQYTRHVLERFETLTEQNPRAMKRVVNAYGVQRQFNILLHTGIDREAIALWTILSLRWPLLAEVLKKSPTLVKKIGTRLEKEGISDEIKELFDNEEVEAVIKGQADNVKASLTEDIIRKLAGLQATTSSAIPGNGDLTKPSN